MSSSMAFFDENFAKNVNCECYCCRKNGCFKDTIAKTSSVWHTRNNSSNVSSLLAPDLEGISGKSTSIRSTISKPAGARRTIKSAALTSKSSEVTSHCEGCYCRQNLNLPLRNLTPERRHETEQRRSNLRSNIYCRCGWKPDHGVRRLPKEPERNLRTCLGGNNARDKMLEASLPIDALNFTNVRRGYETRVGDLHKIDESEEISETRKDDRSVELATTSYDNPKSYKDFKEMAEFRKEQYFDCHSTSDVNASGVSQHKCVHKFVVNDRLLPQPLNGDSYGISRCDICNKPMETFKSERPQPQTVAKSINKVKEIYEYNLAAHKLNIGSGKETVQIKVPEGLGRDVMWQYNNFKIKRKVPGNSFALRYQRGIV